jgi:[acyl-carrier-protein] S-malonyltransferase
MSKKVAFLFPGQGSQFVGMGLGFSDQFPEAKLLFEQANEICQKSISGLCFEGPMPELTLTQNLQPAITAVNLACLLALGKSGMSATVSAGHSLGEYSALVSAGVVSAFDAIRLVQKRGELMHREALLHPGSMAAIIGIDIDDVIEVVTLARENDTLAVANYNSTRQIVITGEEGPLSRAVRLAKERGGKAIPLKVSGAWHSALMQDAVSDFRSFLEEIPFSKPQSMILFNTTAQNDTDPENIKDIMARQLISPVKWYHIILQMLEDGVETFVEVGPKNVLTGLLKKIVPPDQKVAAYSVQDPPSLNEFMLTL